MPDRTAVVSSIVNDRATRLLPPYLNSPGGGILPAGCRLSDPQSPHGGRSGDRNTTSRNGQGLVPAHSSGRPGRGQLHVGDGLLRAAVVQELLPLPLGHLVLVLF